MVNKSYPCKKQFGIKIIFDHVKLLKVVIGQIMVAIYVAKRAEELICNSLTIKANGTAIKVGYVTRRSYPAKGHVFRQGIVPVARGVWRGTCQVGCDWLSDRVTMMQGYKCL